MGRNPANTHVRFWRDPDLPGVEVRASRYNEDAFRPHVHDAWSIGLIDAGRTTFLLGETSHAAARGQMVVIGPGAVHACNPDPGAVMAYRMFYVDPGLVDEAAAEVLGRVDSEARPRFASPVIDDADLFQLWRRLHVAVAVNAGALEKQSLLMQGLADLLTRHGRLGGPCPCVRVPEAVELVHGHLAAHLDERVGLDDLSILAGVSRYHLLRLFSRETGLPPHAYQNQLRVARARTLLARGEPISQVAAEVGFADQSHFSRVFRQFTGATPRQYQSGSQD
ncbi:helix-turn-helix domain-containing protein [Pseudodesulfovibrio sp. F-1]|uniref:Helix-turn-helix domain-containing protein n=1 Tax=Pseudodesulfovibrio alkaliphilus TaxID=2661613 RepID=A0A7K1KNY1_9BACT|nr:AraC family transcriptional regulator [Pseudodesulfovibrio alkaliphilus]MUM77805.1 helix-turn-helix domain-containing protein [Pseudodesulfovibrio alkaliphilus]